LVHKNSYSLNSKNYVKIFRIVGLLVKFLRNMKKNILLVAAMLFLPFCKIFAFTDIESNALNRLLERGVIEINEENSENEKFFPQNNCSRQQFVFWALKNVNTEIPDNFFVEPFSDVSRESEFFKEIAFSWQLGVIETKTKFYPTDPINRLDALKILLKLEQVSIPRFGFKIGNFVDLPEKLEDQAVIAKALAMNIIEPKDKEIFGVKHRLTKIEAVEILDAVSLLRKSEEVIFHISTKKIDTESRAINTSSQNPHFDDLLQTFNLIDNYFLYSEKIDEDNMIIEGTKSIVNFLGDKNTNFLSPDQTKNFLTGVGVGNEFGIGAYVDVNPENQDIVIIAPIRGSPAEKAGVLPGDIIKKVNGVDVSNKSLDEVITMIKGEENTVVTVEFLRNNRTINIEITRGSLNPISLFAKKWQNFLLVEVEFFGKNTAKHFHDALEANPQLTENGLILDLRGNPGGLLEVAVDFLGEIIPEGEKILSTESKDKVETRKSTGPGEFSEIPIIVLVDDFSASASEIVAGAIQDLGRGIVVGQKTFGKGTVQEIVQFPSGSSLKMTIAEWKTPLGKNINKVGIEPNFVFSTENDSEIWDQAAKMIKRGQWQNFEIKND